MLLAARGATRTDASIIASVGLTQEESAESAADTEELAQAQEAARQAEALLTAAESS